MRFWWCVVSDFENIESSDFTNNDSILKFNWNTVHVNGYENMKLTR